MAGLPDAGVRREGSTLVLDLAVNSDETANSERVVCGQESRLYVRAGLDRGYHSPDAIGALTRSILDGDESPVVAMMNRANRARLAASALRGWVEHQNG